MGLVDGIFHLCGQVVQLVQKANDITELARIIPVKVQEYAQEFNEIFNNDWSARSQTDREAAVERIKQHVINVLIPGAGVLSLSGVPGILVYTPCQIIGAVAIAHIYKQEFMPDQKSIMTVVGVMMWGKVGQVVWLEVLPFLGSLFPLPGLGIDVISFVQRWTNLALNKVHDYYRTNSPKPKLPTHNSVPSSQLEASTRPEPVLTNLKLEEARNSEVLKEAAELREHISKGGKILFPAQEEVFRELIQNPNSQSALALGRTHLFRGVAGSGKTVILGQLVPHLAEAFYEKHGDYPRILVYHHNNYIHELLRCEIRSAMLAPIMLQPMPDSLYEKTVHVHTLSTLIKDELPRRRLITNIPSSESIDGSERARQIRNLLRHRNGIFDIVFVDEGQDIDEQEYALLADLCRNDPQTGSKSLYVFYDDLQNIFGKEGRVLSRLHSQEPIEHFLSRCVRTSKRLMDFTLNACLGSTIDSSTRVELERIMNIEELTQRKLILETNSTDGGAWLDCRFCVFPGEVTPEVRQFRSNHESFDALSQDLDRLFSQQGLNEVLRGGVLIQCFSNNMVQQVYDSLHKKFGEKVKRRSGDGIYAQVKRQTLAVEQDRINVSLVWDAKGYDANVVYVLNPDGAQGATSLRQRAQFYVAATRAKQFLAVYNSIPEKNAPIMYDALRAVQQIEQQRRTI